MTCRVSRTSMKSRITTKIGDHILHSSKNALIYICIFSTQTHLFSSLSGKWDLPLLSVPSAQYHPPPFSFPPKNGTNTKNIAQITKIMPIPCMFLHYKWYFLVKNPFFTKNPCIFPKNICISPKIIVPLHSISIMSVPDGRPTVDRRSTDGRTTADPQQIDGQPTTIRDHCGLKKWFKNANIYLVLVLGSCLLVPTSNSAAVQLPTAQRSNILLFFAFDFRTSSGL